MPKESRELYADEWSAGVLIGVVVTLGVAGALIGTFVTLKCMQQWTPAPGLDTSTAGSGTAEPGGRNTDHYAFLARQAAILQDNQRTSVRVGSRAITVGAMFMFESAGQTFLISTGSLEVARLILPSKELVFGQMVPTSFHFSVPTSNNDIVSGNLDLNKMLVTLDQTKKSIPLFPLAHDRLPGVEPTDPISQCGTDLSAGKVAWNPSYTYNFDSLTVSKSKGSIVSIGQAPFVDGSAIASVDLLNMMVFITFKYPQITNGRTVRISFTVTGELQPDMAFTLSPCPPVLVPGITKKITVSRVSGVLDVLTQNVILTYPGFGNQDKAAPGDQVLLRAMHLSEIYPTNSI